VVEHEQGPAGQVEHEQGPAGQAPAADANLEATQALRPPAAPKPAAAPGEPDASRTPALSPEQPIRRRTPLAQLLVSPLQRRDAGAGVAQLVDQRRDVAFVMRLSVSIVPNRPF
jgi:hypothetical protein